MAYCGQCGAKNTEGIKFCSSCGKEIGKTVSFYRQNKNLVVKQNCELPPICLKCAQPATGDPSKKTFVFYNRSLLWWFLLYFLGFIIFLISYFSTRKLMKLAMPLCDRHKKIRRNKLLIGTGLLVIVPIALGLIASVIDSSDFTLYGINGAIAAMLIGIILIFKASPLQVVRINDTEGIFKGAGDAFLKRIEGSEFLR